MVIAGVTMIVHTLILKKRNLEPVTAEITGTFKRQISRESKILKGSKFTYYPIVLYRIDDKDCIRRCDVNASREDAFRKGDTITLYYDRTRNLILEKNASILILLIGIVLTGAGILAGISILSAL